MEGLKKGRAFYWRTPGRSNARFCAPGAGFSRLDEDLADRR
jgi:hypothetical protein